MQTLMSGHQQSLVTKVLSDAKLNIQDNPSYECRVNALWSKGLQEAEKQGKSLFDGPILRLHAVQTYAVKKQVHLHIAPSSYRYFFAAENIVDNRQKCETIWQQRVVPVGSQTYLLTKNDDVILFKRSAKLSIAPEMLRGLGGTSDLAVDCVDGKLDFQKTAFREASEELLVPLDNIGLTKQCFNLAGFILNSKYWMGTAIYWAKTNLNANQAADLPMDSEHTQVQVVPKHYLHQFTRQLRFQDRSLSYYLSLIRRNIERPI